MLSRTGRLAAIALLAQGVALLVKPNRAQAAPIDGCDTGTGWCCVLVPECKDSGVGCCYVKNWEVQTSTCGCEKAT